MSCSHSRHWSLVGIRPRLAQASCTAAVHSRQLMKLGEPPTAVRVPAWLPPDADRLPRWFAREWQERPERNCGQDAFLISLGKTQPDISIRLPRRDESLTSGTLFLRLSIIMLPCRQRCSSPIVTLAFMVDSSFGTWQLFFFLRSSAVRHGGRFRLRTVLFHVAVSSCPWFIDRTDWGTSLRMPGVLHGPTASIMLNVTDCCYGLPLSFLMRVCTHIFPLQR